jgi:hypothetical protein
VVNFDPDTAGARATERTLGLLVEEEFNIKFSRWKPDSIPTYSYAAKAKTLTARRSSIRRNISTI